jgi:hypothetical protein
MPASSRGGRFRELGRVEVDPFPALGGFERARQDAVDAVDGAGFHRVADMRLAARQRAVVARTRPGGPVSRGGVAVRGRVPCNLGSAAVADDQQPFLCELEERVLDGAWLQSLEPGEFGYGGEVVAGEERTAGDSFSEPVGRLPPSRSRVGRVGSQVGDVTVLGERPTSTCQLAALLQTSVAG